MEIEILEKIGLTRNEAKVYIALFELGSTTTGAIIKKTGIHASKVYESLQRLVEKGLVGYVVKANRKFFGAANPEKLLEIEKEKEIAIKKLIPELKTRKLISKKKQEATIYEGYKGIRTIFEDVLRELKQKEEFLVFSAVSTPKFFEDYFDQWNKRRVKRKIIEKIVFNEEAKKVAKKRAKLPLTEVKLIPKEFTTPAVMNIYGNKVAIVVWTSEPLGIVIEGDETADSFRKYFNLLWKSARK